MKSGLTKKKKICIYISYLKDRTFEIIQLEKEKEEIIIKKRVKKAYRT